MRTVRNRDRLAGSRRSDRVRIPLSGGRHCRIDGGRRDDGAWLSGDVERRRVRRGARLHTLAFANKRELEDEFSLFERLLVCVSELVPPTKALKMATLFSLLMCASNLPRRIACRKRREQHVFLQKICSDIKCFFFALKKRTCSHLFILRFAHRNVDHVAEKRRLARAALKSRVCNVKKRKNRRT